MDRAVSWVTAAEKAFQQFPAPVQSQMRTALEVAAAGQTTDIAKPMKGLGAGVYELRIAYRRNAYRADYAVQIGSDLWVVHAFQKKSTQGIKTPKKEIDLIRSRLKRLQETFG